MLVRSRRAAFVIGAALVAFAAACTNPTAPAATSNNARGGISGDGVVIGTGGHSATTTDGVVIGTGG
jgi:hypothetical protein